MGEGRRSCSGVHGPWQPRNVVTGAGSEVPPAFLASAYDVAKSYAPYQPTAPCTQSETSSAPFGADARTSTFGALGVERAGGSNAFTPHETAASAASCPPAD